MMSRWSAWERREDKPPGGSGGEGEGGAAGGRGGRGPHPSTGRLLIMGQTLPEWECHSTWNINNNIKA